MNYIIRPVTHTLLPHTTNPKLSLSKQTKGNLILASTIYLVHSGWHFKPVRNLVWFQAHAILEWRNSIDNYLIFLSLRNTDNDSL